MRDHLMPDFLVIGAGKSGTTSLDNYLSQHPEIYMSPRKEPNFFAYEKFDISKVIFKESVRHYNESVLNLVDYQELFKGAKNCQRKGETSNIYLYNPLAILRIKYYVPDVKLIAILRHPSERLYSRFLHLARENQLPTPEFTDLFDRGNIWWQRPDLVHEGFYFKHLSQYFSQFREDQIKVYLYDDLRSSPNLLLADVFKYLDVSEKFVPDTSLEFNASGYIKNPIVEKWIGSNGLVFRPFKKLSPKIFQRAKANLAIQKLFWRVRSKNLYRPKLDPSIRDQIVNEIYREDILRLQDLIKRDLSHWLR